MMSGVPGSECLWERMTLLTPQQGMQVTLTARKTKLYREQQQWRNFSYSQLEYPALIPFLTLFTHTIFDDRLHNVHLLL